MSTNTALHRTTEELASSQVASYRPITFAKFNEAGILDSPRRFDLQVLAPQLNAAGIQRVIAEAYEKGVSYFRGPGSLVLGAFHQFQLRHNRGAAKDLHWTSIGWVGASRDKHSYLAPNFNNTPEEFGRMYFAATSTELDLLNNAQQTIYSGHLVKDVWERAFHAVVADPRRRDRHHDLKPLHEFWCAMDRPVTISIGDATLYPALFQLEQAIQYIVTDRFQGAELFGHRQPIKGFFCSLCGGPLHVTHCGYCHTRIKARELHRVSTAHPLPMKLVGQIPLENFERHPFRAIKHYYGSWAAHGNHGTLAQKHEKRQDEELNPFERVIDLGVEN